jgi:hypothetical protein
MIDKFAEGTIKSTKHKNAYGKFFPNHISQNAHL